MREIKFRAWNGETMISPDYISREGVGFWKENSIPTSIDKLMQFTGTKDKNGKEVYEGDIIAEPNYDYSPDRGNDPVVLSAVEFKRGCFLTKEGPVADEEDIEVIGNIYETPGLLK